MNKIDIKYNLNNVTHFVIPSQKFRYNLKINKRIKACLYHNRKYA